PPQLFLAAPALENDMAGEATRGDVRCERFAIRSVANQPQPHIAACSGEARNCVNENVLSLLPRQTASRDDLKRRRIVPKGPRRKARGINTQPRDFNFSPVAVIAHAHQLASAERADGADEQRATDFFLQPKADGVVELG